MDQLKKIFATLSLSQKIGLGAVILALAIGLPMFTKWQRESSFRPLFTNLAPEDAGAIVAKLKEAGIDFRLAENGTSVLVPAEKVDEQRLELAGAGLPKTGRIGFELFDKTNLSLTDFGEHVNYRRAVEGELEKTIKSINGIDQARVHVTFPKDSVFLDSREPAKASVLLHLRPGLRLQPQNVVAIANLVGSAVEGLSPDGVSIVDMQGNLLSRVRKPSFDGADSAGNELDYKRDIEKDLTSKVESTLAPLLGDGHFRVGVTVDCDFSTSQQTDELYDPSRSVMANSQKTEDLSQGASAGGVPGTASNLPRSQIRTQAGIIASGAPAVSRRTESTSFETSRTVREVKVPRGVVKKISAALLVDQEVEWQGKGAQRKRIFIPPSPEKLKVIHDLTAGVLGISMDRGDQLVVESLPFEQSITAEDLGSNVSKPAASGPLTLKDLTADKRVLIGAGAGMLFVVLLVVFLLRRPKSALVQIEQKPAISPARTSTAAVTSDAKSAISSQMADTKPDSQLDAVKEIEEAMPVLQLPAMNNQTKALLDHLRKSINKDPESAVNIIMTWMEEM